MDQGDEERDENDLAVDSADDNESTGKGEWFSAKELTGVKKINGKRHYRVVWENESEPPSWVQENDVSELLKQNYHIRHTQEGAVRKALKHKRKRRFV